MAASTTNTTDVTVKEVEAVTEEKPAEVAHTQATKPEDEPKNVAEAKKTVDAKTVDAKAGEPSAASAAGEQGENNSPDAGGVEDELLKEDELVKGDWNIAKIDLKPVEIVTGEEEEDVVWNHRAKLYRWINQEWKERGLGDAKLLKHKVNKKTRFLLRQEKTLKVVANHIVLPMDKCCKLEQNAGNDKILVWTVQDYADEAPRIEQFGLKFGQVEAANEFKAKFEEYGAENLKIYESEKEKKKAN